MKCPKCGKDVELQNKQVGVDKNGEPIFNEYAVCKDCKKQWNLDKQRAKKAAQSSAPNHTQPRESSAPKSSHATAGSSSSKAAPARTEKAPVRKPAVKKDPAQAAPAKRPDKVPPQPSTAMPKKRPAKASVQSREPDEDIKIAAAPGSKPSSPAKKPSAPGKNQTPRKTSGSSPAPRPVKQDEGQQYGNIPPENVRAKKERAVRQNYEDMLSTDPNRKPVKKKTAAPAKGDEPRRRQPAGTAPPRKRPQPVQREPEEIDMDEPAPKFRIARILLGILSIIAFAFFSYKGFLAGLNNISSGSDATTGTTYIVLALCMLVSGLLLLIMQKKHTIFAFILPMVFYLGSGVFAFLKRSDDNLLLYGAIAGGIMAVVFLVLTIASRGSNAEDDDSDDAFEDDYAD